MGFVEILIGGWLLREKWLGALILDDIDWFVSWTGLNQEKPADFACIEISDAGEQGMTATGGGVGVV